MPRQSCDISHGMESGSSMVAPVIIDMNVNRMGPYLGNNRVDSTLCHAQQAAAPIINKSPRHESVKDTSDLPKSTSVAAPLNERIIPVRTPALKCSFFMPTPMRKANTG